MYEDIEKFKADFIDYLSEVVPDPYSKELMIAGGSFFRFFHKLPVRDVDVYFSNTSEFVKNHNEITSLGCHKQTIFIKKPQHNRSTTVRDPERPVFAKLESTNKLIPSIDLINCEEVRLDTAPRNWGGLSIFNDYEIPDVFSRIPDIFSRIIESFDITLCQSFISGDHFAINDLYNFKNKQVLFNPKMSVSKDQKVNNTITRALKYVELGCSVSDSQWSQLYNLLASKNPDHLSSFFSNYSKL